MHLREITTRKLDSLRKDKMEAMLDVHQVWAEAMPEVKNAVTGVGLWSALNNSRAVVLEGDTFVLGMPHEMSDLAGHLRINSTKILIERALAARIGSPITVRIIEGTSEADWELIRRKDEEQRRLQQVALNRAQAEVKARGSWDTVYEQISRQYAAMTNKSLPQNRAKFYQESITILLEALKSMPIDDDLSERNFARCIERVAQYSEVPSVLVANELLLRHQP